MAASTHPDFPDGTEVINVRPKSRFFGQRGVVYGSGPGTLKNSTNSAAVIFVRWPSGDAHKYLPSRLAPAPLRESEYRTSSNTREGKKTTIHKVPAAKRPRPTLAQFVAAQSSTTDSEE